MTTPLETMRQQVEAASPGPRKITECLDYWIEAPADNAEGMVAVALYGDMDWQAEDSNAVRDQDTMRATVVLALSSDAIVRALVAEATVEEVARMIDPDAFEPEFQAVYAIVAMDAARSILNLIAGKAVEG